MNKEIPFGEYLLLISVIAVALYCFVINFSDTNSLRAQRCEDMRGIYVRIYKERFQCIRAIRISTHEE